MSIKNTNIFLKFKISAVLLSSIIIIFSCKTKKQISQSKKNAVEADTVTKCKLDIKSAKYLIEKMQKNTFNYDWIYAKAETKMMIDSEETDVNIKIRSKRDSAILITVEAINLFDVAKILITNDSVKMIIYPKKQYYYGDIENISKLLNISVDLDLIQSVFFGNNAEFYKEEERVKLVNDKKDCLYLLTTTKKRKIKRLIKDKEILRTKEPIQIINIHPVTFKIIRNHFIDVKNNHSLIVDYQDFQQMDSLYFPKKVLAKIIANNPLNFNLQYSKIEINKLQTLSFRIPGSYEKKEIK